MTVRIFAEVPIKCGDQSFKAMKIACAQCEAVAYSPVHSGHGRKPPIAAVQYFQNRNWVVGRTPRKDACPACARRSSRKGTKAMVDRPAPAADKPRDMSRDDRRIINDKLDAVYGVDAYKSPWTDAAVARDLGVPRDWVARVRDQFFGEAVSNPLLDEYLAAKAAVEQRMEAVGAIYASLVGCHEAYVKEFSDLHKQVDDLRLLGRRIEKEIGK